MVEGGGGPGGFSEEQMKLEYTPTWIVAGVCSVIVLISLVVERLLHRVGKVEFFSPTLFILIFFSFESLLLFFCFCFFF